jgi:hypothetical protein
LQRALSCEALHTFFSSPLGRFSFSSPLGRLSFSFTYTTAFCETQQQEAATVEGTEAPVAVRTGAAAASPPICLSTSSSEEYPGSTDGERPASLITPTPFTTPFTGWGGFAAGMENQYWDSA